MRVQHRFLGFASLILAGSLLALPAHAHYSGITGHSGKQGVICTDCHTSNANPKPTVQLSGPSVIAPGDTGHYTLTITGGPGTASGGYGGMNVAVDNTSALLQPGTGLQRQSGELTHVGGKAFSGNSVSFDFSLVAPPSTGSVTLYAAGNSTDGNGTLTNDQSAATTLNILVSDDPYADAGTAGPDGGTGADGGTSGSDAGVTPPDAGTGDGGGSDKDSGGCAAVGGPPLAWLLVLAARVRRRAQSR